MKRFSLLALAAAALFAPAGAHAAVPCRDKIYNEWYASGKISTSYPIACYHDALQHIPVDAQVYSNLGGDIKAALQAALARKRNPGAKTPSAVGRGFSSSVSRTGETKGVATTAVAVAAPLASSPSSGGGVPLPILVLGAIAILLAAAGAIGTGVKQYRKRSAA